MQGLPEGIREGITMPHELKKEGGKAEDGRAKVLVVDDDNLFLEIISAQLDEFGYHVTVCDDPKRAVTVFGRESFDLVLSDIQMPDIDGVELVGKFSAIDNHVPVILMTAHGDTETAMQVVRKGAADFIMKPFTAEHLAFTLEKAMKFSRLLDMDKRHKLELEGAIEEKTKQLSRLLIMGRDLTVELMQRLTKVAEFRDPETGTHIKRLGMFAWVLAEELGMDDSFVEAIAFAGPMHDIGKVGIPDSILLKEGPLDPHEYETMKTHTTNGNLMLAGSNHRSLQLAASIAHTHHERWDGTGYPRGLGGEDIPVEGRIVMVCDVYDALMSKRPYKGSMSHKESLEVMTVGNERTRPGHFDPKVLDVFVGASSRFEEIFHANQ